jgi:hypothetical protein
MRKLLIRLPELSGRPTGSHLVAKQGELEKGNCKFGRRIVLVHTSK